MPANKRRLLKAALVTGIAALTAGAYWAGEHAAKAGFFHAGGRGHRDSGSRDSTVALPPRQHPPEIRRDHLAAAAKRLKNVMENCVNLDFDWETAAVVDGILADLSPDELAQLYADTDAVADRALSLKIGACWAAKDPAAALKAALAKTPGTKANAAEIFGRWARNEPAAALAWLGSPDCPPELAASKDEYYASALHDMVQRDFSLATESLGKMSQKAAAGVLDAWGSAYSGDPEMRDRLVDFAKGTGQSRGTIPPSMRRC